MRRPRGVRLRVVAAGSLLVVGLGALSLSSRPTTAAWTDSGNATSGSFATLPRLAAPTLSCSVLGVASVGFTWTAVAGATNYVFSITPTGGSTTTTTYPSTVTSTTRINLVSTGRVTVLARRAYPSTNWDSNPSNPVDYLVAAVTLCS